MAGLFAEASRNEPFVSVLLRRKEKLHEMRTITSGSRSASTTPRFATAGRVNGFLPPELRGLEALGLFWSPALALLPYGRICR